MTMPFERTRAVLYTRAFLSSLADPQQTPRVPKAIRQKASRILRHYPTPFDIKQIVELEQHVFGVARDEPCEKQP